ncbi:MAG: DUF547 domain-containing protein [Saprospiraceae bacterium]|nr:DUF547 domain-containing protein [Saprospiraceae bacterium]
MHRFLSFMFFVLAILSAGAQGITNLQTFTEKADDFFSQEVTDGRLNYAHLKNDARLTDLWNFIAEYQFQDLAESDRKAYLVNAYNLLVIKGVLDAYPIQSTLKVFGFFDRNTFKMGSGEWTLDALEKGQILAVFNDPRLHFALACGAESCPPLGSFAYTAKSMEQQLEERARAALNDSTFIKVDGNSSLGSQDVKVSKIFDWYAKDFGGNKDAIISYVNTYRDFPLTSSAELSYYPYDWTLNDLLVEGAPKNLNRYVVSSAIPKGGVEVKWFNNLYTQRFPPPAFSSDSRENYFTVLLNFVYGLTDRFNIGFDLRYRRVSLHETPASPLKIFSFSDAVRSKAAIATIGPKIRVAPNANWPNFSIQSAFWIPLKEDLANSPFLDWNGFTWWTQAFNDFDVGTDFALFTELDLLIEDIGKKEEGGINRLSTPVTAIFSYFPTSVSTVYALTNFSPYWSPDLDYFFQAGMGAKYQLTPQWEVELLYTFFTNSFIQEMQGQAATINLGVRYSSW